MKYSLALAAIALLTGYTAHAKHVYHEIHCKLSIDSETVSISAPYGDESFVPKVDNGTRIYIDYVPKQAAIPAPIEGDDPKIVASTTKFEVLAKTKSSDGCYETEDSKIKKSIFIRAVPGDADKKLGYSVKKNHSYELECSESISVPNGPEC